MRVREAKIRDPLIFMLGQDDCPIADFGRFQAAATDFAVTGRQPYAITLAKFTKGGRAALPLAPVPFGVSEAHRKSSA
jgi:hypothetical protein